MVNTLSASGTIHLLISRCVLYRVSGSTLTAVGRSQLLAQWPGTHSWILSGIQRAAQTVLGVFLHVLVHALLMHLNDYVLYKSTHSLTLFTCLLMLLVFSSLQCFDTVGWASGRASGL